MGLWDELNEIREGYRRRMVEATSKAQQCAGEEDMEGCSIYSTEAERLREAFAALSQAIRVAEKYDPI